MSHNSFPFHRIASSRGAVLFFCPFAWGTPSFHLPTYHFSHFMPAFPGFLLFFWKKSVPLLSRRLLLSSSIGCSSRVRAHSPYGFIFAYILHKIGISY